MGKIIKKHIKPDKDNLGSQVVIYVKEDNQSIFWCIKNLFDL
jgi:hypothetical protein